MSKVSLEKLNDVQFDVLKEIGNIGAGNATTALSTMLNVKTVSYTHLDVYKRQA